MARGWTEGILHQGNEKNEARLGNVPLLTLIRLDLVWLGNGAGGFVVFVRFKRVTGWEFFWVISAKVDRNLD
jgi:hypothetical protein